MNLFAETIEAMKEVYPDIALDESGTYATHLITPIKKLTIYDGKKPGEWDIININTNETISAGDAGDIERLLIAEVMQELTKQQKNIEKEITNERLNSIQNTKSHDTQTYGEDPEQWKKPPVKHQSGRNNEYQSESVNLPAPVGPAGIVRPAVSAAEALAAWKEFQDLKKAIISKTDVKNIQGKDHIVKSGWRKFATFYNLTDRIVEENRAVREDLGLGAFQWKIKVICTAPNGRETEGIAICTSTEKKFSHPEHDVYTTCHTRAKNRAISDMIAAGEVSAEELEA